MAPFNHSSSCCLPDVQSGMLLELLLKLHNKEEMMKYVSFLIGLSTQITKDRICVIITVQEGSPFSSSSPTSVVSCIINFSHPDSCEVISHCGFDLHFPDDGWCWASFHVSVGHLDVFFGKMSVHVFWPFLNWIIWFWGIEFYEFFIDFGYYLSDMSFANIFSHLLGCLLVLLIVSLAMQELLILMKPQ